ncbi:MAG: lipoyl synthase, partial [Candidatus Kariarchaeaceae archaeon]
KTSRTPLPLNPNEPKQIAMALKEWDLNYVVLTSVDRDDLEDGGASHLADCITQIKKQNPELRIEILIPDFQGNPDSLEKIIAAQPDVIAHNIETVKRLTSNVRDRRASYDQSLTLLKQIKGFSRSTFTKSSVMVGLGESIPEVIETMEDLKHVGVDFLTIGQYMRPGVKQLPVQEYIPPSVFADLKTIGEKMGFQYVASNPLVRSSYKAGEFYIYNVLQNQGPSPTQHI